MFSDTIIEQCPDLIDYINKIEMSLKRHEELHIAKIKRNKVDKLNKTILIQDGIIYIQRLLKRSKFLIEGLIRETNNQYTTVSLTILRAHYETTAALIYFYDVLHKFHNKEISLEEYFDKCYTLYMGSRDDSIKNLGINSPKSINVLTMINKADSYLDKENTTETKNLFKDCYLYLCEFAHPNALGTLEGIKEVTSEKYVFTNKARISKHEIETIVVYLLLSVSNFIKYYEKCLDMLNY